MSTARPVVYADEAMIVLDKPSGLLSVPGRGPENHDSLSVRVQAQFPDALIVHRLDMGTSGLLVMARGIEAQRTLSQHFAERRTRKRYVAIAQGELPQRADWSTIDAPLIVDWPNRPRSKVDHAIGKPSVTHWRRLGEQESCVGLARDHFRPAQAHSVLDLEPVTGRSHQLRVHLLSIGYPIAGDTLYGDAANQAMATRLLLHAYALQIPHPVSSQDMHFCCPTRFA